MGYKTEFQGLQIDDSQFRAALKEYIAATSKDVVSALNGKAKDLAYAASRQTRRARRDDIQRIFEFDPDRERNFVTWVCNQAFGRGGWTMHEWKVMFKRLKARRMKAIGYMKSGWTKGAKLFRANEATTISADPDAATNEKYPGTRAQATIATANRLLASMDIQWADDDARDKQEIARHALILAIDIVADDMRQYLERKQERLARVHSAK